MIAVFLNNVLIGFCATVIMAALLYVVWVLYGLSLNRRRPAHRRSVTEEGGQHE